MLDIDLTNKTIQVKTKVMGMDVLVPVSLDYDNIILSPEIFNYSKEPGLNIIEYVKNNLTNILFHFN